MNLEYKVANSGSREYSQGFIDQYGTLLRLNTGEENTDMSADFELGVPLPSFGIKVSY